MDQLICASLSHTHYWYEVGMLKVSAVWEDEGRRLRTYYIPGSTSRIKYLVLHLTCNIKLLIINIGYDCSGCGKERRILIGPW